MSVSGFNNRVNYSSIRSNQQKSTLRHSFRQKMEEYEKHLNKEKSKLNKYLCLSDLDRENFTSKNKPEEAMAKILEHLEKIKIDFKINSQNSEEDLEIKSKLNKQKHNTKNALKGKDLDLADYEKSGMTPEEYINTNWTKEYKSESITKRMKKRTLESLLKYENMKKSINVELKETLQTKGTTANLQEVVFKITKNENNEDYTEKELNEIFKIFYKREKEKGNIILGRRFHFDESSNHIHIFVSNKKYELLKNQYDYINKKYNKNFKYLKMTKPELVEFGELQQKDDLEISQQAAPRLDIKRSWELDPEWVKTPKTEEEINNNSKILAFYKMKNKRIHLKQNGVPIQERDYNNVKLEEEKLKELKKEMEEKSKKMEIDMENISEMSNKELERRRNLKIEKDLKDLDETIENSNSKGGASELSDLINKRNKPPER